MNVPHDEGEQPEPGATDVALLTHRLFAEGLGTMLLVAAVVGSGIMAHGLSPHDTGLALLENAMATGAALLVLIANQFERDNLVSPGL